MPKRGGGLTTSSLISSRQVGPVLWWQDDEVSPGRWVQFEGTLSYVVTVRAFLSWIAVDLDSDSEYAPNPLLLLHGSARHVIGNDGMRSYRRTIGGMGVDGGPGGSEPSVFQLIHHDLEPFLRNSDHQTGDSNNQSLGEVYNSLNGLRHTSSGDMAGYARITGVHEVVLGSWTDHPFSRRLITVTPLYVERV
jgi:hypothetical protein